MNKSTIKAIAMSAAVALAVVYLVRKGKIPGV
jgi:hypothetical protein